MKLLIKLGVILLIGLVLLVIAGFVLVPPASRKALEEGSSYALGVPTHVDSVDADLSLGDSSLGFSGFLVENPDGFGGDAPFMKVGSMAVGVGTRSLLSDTVDVPGIELKGLELNLVQNGQRSNFLEIADHIKGLAGEGGGTETDGESDAASDAARKLIDVRKVHVSGVAASFRLEGLPGVEPKQWKYELPPLDVSFSEGESTMSVSQLTAHLTDKLVANALTEAEGILPSDAYQTLQGAVSAFQEGGLDGLRSEFDERVDEAKGELQEKVDGKVDEAVGEAKGKLEKTIDDRLKGIFKDG